jgi:hypothetical protein
MVIAAVQHAAAADIYGVIEAHLSAERDQIAVGQLI